ncbi:DNA translocase FtsK 4TM domain-containing protein [Wenyingzhuangia sp. chi5]|uniref:DNA translocase FtsK 4TM domain-containing protein n=1 Tax=Wenyingzhuangia gilva TaxID=3057677 RepID=A0ABT8VS16_9FLAO|nr:DNA translocase FtsK 4TM domain-containing protein [Wenyingzhuangia sp. chi5]MDO3694749.1 DNA translocase FtsK 4TM domain-containing protein [Wenyingzhuangia sp. chi5]
MPKKSNKKVTKNTERKEKLREFANNRQTQTVFGLFMLLFSIFLFTAFISFFFTWQADQSTVNQLANKAIEAQNLLGKLGANLSYFFIYKGFGVAAILIPVLLFFTGLYILLKIPIKKIFKSWNWGMLGLIWTATTFGFFADKNALIAGVVGVELNSFLIPYLAPLGLIILIVFGYATYFVIRFKITPEKIKGWLPKKEDISELKNSFKATESDENLDDEEDNKDSEEKNTSINDENEIIKEKIISLDEFEEKDQEVKPTSTFEMAVKNVSPTIQNHSNINVSKKEEIKEELKIDVEQVKKEEITTSNLSDQLVKDFGEFDPTLDLGNYKFPTLNLLREFDDSISVDAGELEANKNKIVDTLNNYKIGIAQIKATVGPTITLYEIVPEAGIRISKIKNLEDDIALSLSALGIRIIAPIPGKGTIGIEVPNQKATVVSMNSVIASNRFQQSKMELPIALGKTIANETFIFDLAKAPHLLMAGATGQGKSVGLNAILTSLLYKKHPAEIKFVLVDPKKVELTLFNKIERHYLAKLPDTDEAIITDTTKVVHTLNSLCIEMDNRYDLLKDAMVRNIKEYNEKFKARKLNPNEGHKFLPYIVLVIDEFADLIMTAGKEVETPIARLAQLARAIGIHLIVATQRPSVNVITGIIKANFPLRIAFRVTSKIDSRTILDAPGADQLIGRGDLLISSGNDLIRVQCAFVDTPEVEKITDFIGSQRAYPEAYQLPEYVGEDGSGTELDIDIADRDKLFREAAETIVIAQQGSASLLQRKLKLGYNRAGRLIDQLEAAGIVGPFEGSKARQVLINDLASLDQMLADEKNN